MQKQEAVMINAQALGKAYQIGNEKLEVLKDVTFSILKAKFVVVSGPSGSGKTTLSCQIFDATTWALFFKRTIWFLP